MRYATLALAVDILLSHEFIQIDGEWMATSDGAALPLDGREFINLTRERAKHRGEAFSSTEIMAAVTLAAWELHRVLPHSRVTHSYSFN